jgi:CheY-like chemotaxis protein
MDGLEVARRIRDDHLPVEPLILMLSSDDLRPQLDRLHELALDAYLVKPITRKELFETIYRVLTESNRKSIKPMPQRKPVKRPVEGPKNSVKTRLLVAEDSPDNRLLISAFLRGQPYAIDFAENGEIAVERFRAQSYSLVLMDIQMPKMDRLAATRLIRQWERERGGGHAMIFALTAAVLDEDVRNAREAGCDLHLSKPIKKRILIDALNDAVSSARDDKAVSANGTNANVIDANGSAFLAKS